MEAIELILIGVSLGVLVIRIEGRCQAVTRLPRQLAAAAAVAVFLRLLHLDITDSAVRFLEFDIGIVIAAYARDIKPQRGRPVPVSARLQGLLRSGLRTRRMARMHHGV